MHCKILSALTIGLLTAMPPAALASPGDDPELVRQVRCTEIAFSQALERRDRDAFSAFMDEDARFIGSRVHRGPAAIVDAWDEFFEIDGPTLKWRPAIVEVLRGGKLALTRGPYRLRTRAEDGALREGWGTFNSVWRKGPDGRWRVIFDAGSPSSEYASAEERETLETTTAEDCKPAAPRG